MRLRETATGKFSRVEGIGPEEVKRTE